MVGESAWRTASMTDHYRQQGKEQNRMECCLVAACLDPVFFDFVFDHRVPPFLATIQVRVSSFKRQTLIIRRKPLS